MANYLKASEAKKGELVTTIWIKFNGIGLGRLIGETVYRTGCNGFYYPLNTNAVNGIPAEYEYVRDGGAGYRRKLRGMGLPPAYKV